MVRSPWFQAWPLLDYYNWKLFVAGCGSHHCVYLYESGLFRCCQQSVSSLVIATKSTVWLSLWNCKTCRVILDADGLSKPDVVARLSHFLGLCWFRSVFRSFQVDCARAIFAKICSTVKRNDEENHFHRWNHIHAWCCLVVLERPGRFTPLGINFLKHEVFLWKSRVNLKRTKLILGKNICKRLLLLTLITFVCQEVPC